ncbi:hypothetical protein GCM10009799_00650 [Nocardiopsis rhodophaea]|uniref:DUF5753 domain-containing protein n=1 Tax=Nocardiopsis rhodophaea TaxID=280238 RepID=A0ABN2S418_9ACTN
MRSPRWPSATRLNWAIVTESVIRNLEDDPEILLPQVDRLLALMDAGRIRLQVIPVTVRFRDHPGLDGPFIILSLPDGRGRLYRGIWLRLLNHKCEIRGEPVSQIRNPAKRGIHP